MGTEAPRLLRRLLRLREWSHHEEVTEVFPRSCRARLAHGFRRQGPVPVAVGGDRVHRRQDRLHGRDAAALGSPGRARQRSARGPTTAEQQRVKELEREVRELRRANEILKLASAFFAQRRADPPPGAVEDARGRRVGDAGVGLVVQSPSTARTNRLHPAGRSRGKLLAPTRPGHRFDRPARSRSAARGEP